jgi:hypothetical protein
VILSVVGLVLAAAGQALARRGADDYYPHHSSRSYSGHSYSHRATEVMYFSHLLDGRWQVFTRVDLSTLPAGHRSGSGGYYAVPVERHHRRHDDDHRYDDRRGRGRDDRYDDRGRRGRQGRGRR